VVDLLAQIAAGERATSGEAAQAVAKERSDVYQQVMRGKGGRCDSRRWNGDWDFVICSSHFVLAQYKKLQKFDKFVEAVATTGKEAARKLAKTRRWPDDPPTLSLFSGLYTLLNTPIRHVILDEAQMVKNVRGKLHEAVKELPHACIIMLSGTIFHNRWRDIFGALDLLKREPFADIADLERVF
jgi:hypothetical protein